MNHSNTFTRFVLKVVGLVFVALAALGVVLPVLPTTPFLLVAAGCFAKSSPWLYEKLLANKFFGVLIRDWQQYRSIPKRGKVIALVTMVLACSWSCYLLTNLYLKVLVIGLMILPFIFVYRLPTTESIGK